MRNAQFSICDDVRSELGGKYSLMGVYGPLVQIGSDDAVSFTVVSMLHAEYDEDLTQTKIQLCLAMDEDEEVFHDFPAVSVQATASATKPEDVILIEKAIPGYTAPAVLFGMVRIEGVEFAKKCRVTTTIDGQVFSEHLLVRRGFAQSFADG